MTLALVAILRAGPTLGIRAVPERTEAILRGPSHARRKHADLQDRASETDGGPTLHAVILTEGRAARGGRRAELFAPGAVIWPPDGIEIRTVHLGPTQARAVPVRQGAEIHVSAPATPALAAAVKSGKDRMSVEFHALAETRTASGVREIEQAVITGATVTTIPEYAQTRAELRERKRVRLWL